MRPRDSLACDFNFKRLLKTDFHEKCLFKLYFTWREKEKKKTRKDQKEKTLSDLSHFGNEIFFTLIDLRDMISMLMRECENKNDEAIFP